MSSFLDNSGDIILDVTLTETGRVRLSQGQFQISKFALGDDEIQYTLYDKNHPSGSAYYDLEILQTPILQAMTMRNANINYGLLSLARNDLLYLPELMINEKVGAAVSTYGGAFYLAVNADTKQALDTAIGPTRALQTNVGNTPAVLVESGLNTGDLKGTAANRSTYIIGVNLLDSTFQCSVDSRFLVSVLSPAAGGTFANDANGTMTVNFGTLAGGGAGTGGSSVPVANYTTFSARGIADLVYYYGNTSVLDTANSALGGPRGTITALNWEVDSDLISASPGTTRSEKYTNFGSTDQTAPWGGSALYDWVDTTVYLVGAASSAVLQIPVRIIRLVST